MSWEIDPHVTFSPGPPPDTPPDAPAPRLTRGERERLRRVADRAVDMHGDFWALHLQSGPLPEGSLDYIEAASPTAVSALLDRIEALEEKNRALKNQVRELVRPIHEEARDGLP